jgi:hypothetical protein
VDGDLHLSEMSEISQAWKRCENMTDKKITKPVNAISLTAARLAIATAVLALLLLASLHILSPEFDPSWRMISEYANGQYGWVLSLMFASWGVSSWALAFAIWSQVRTRACTARVMLFDSKDSWIETLAFFRLFLEDADKAYQQALDAGGTSVTKITEMAWGDRVGRVRDPFGNIWWLQTHVADVPYVTRMKEQKWIEAMQYVQQSLAKALNRQK